MPNIINGQHLTVQENDGIMTIAFANNTDQPTVYLLLQRTLLPSEQDKRLGQDKVYVELNEQSQSAYGGIQRVQLQGKQLLLTLDDKTAYKLGSEHRLGVKIELDAQGVENLRKQLTHLFAGEEVIVE